MFGLSGALSLGSFGGKMMVPWTTRANNLMDVPEGRLVKDRFPRECQGK